jgi:hypothetical protein
VTGRASLANHSNDLTRQTNDGIASANDVNSNAWLLGVGLAYRGTLGRYRTHLAVETAAYSVVVDPFLEKNGQSVLDALSVQRQDDSGTSLILNAAMGGALTDKLDFNVGMRVVQLTNTAQAVTARVGVEDTNFTVQNPGLGRTQTSVNAELSYKLKDNATVGVSLRAFGDHGFSADLAYRMAF